MRLTIEPEATITVINGTPCREWRGTSDKGVPVHVFVAAVGVSDELPEADREAFERELVETVPRVGASALLIMKEPGPTAGGN